MYPFNMPNQQFSQPMQNYNSYPIMNNSLIRVTGIEGAKAYQMQPNSTVALFDNNEDYMYIKSTDGAGFPTIRTFRFEEVTNTPKQDNQIDMSAYITREELTEILKDFKGGLGNGKQFIQQSKESTSTKQ